jgi:ferredoxin
MNNLQANQILMVGNDATFTEIRYAYRKLALELHPDKNQKEKTGHKFKIVLEAYELNGNKKSHTNNFENAFWDETKQNDNKKPEKKHYEKYNDLHKHNLTVDIDKSLCIGCCSCETIAPKVFFVDKITHINPKSSVHNIHGAKENKIMDAAETCPTKAILVNEKDSGRRIFPR